MTSEFVLAYVARKMRELGVGDNYTLAFREMIVGKTETITISAPDHFYYLIDGFVPQLRITSDMGFYDLEEPGTNELQHEHTGTITISNKEIDPIRLQFIVAIPMLNPDPAPDADQKKESHENH